MDDVIRESVFAKINRESDEARMARKALSVRADDNVWCSHTPWMECGADSGGLRPTEDTVFAHYSRISRWRFLAMRAKQGEELEVFVADVMAKIKAESDEAQEPMVVQEPIHHPNHKLPLRDVMAQRGEGIEWMELGADLWGKKHVRAVVVKIGLGKKGR